MCSSVAAIPLPELEGQVVAGAHLEQAAVRQIVVGDVGMEAQGVGILQREELGDGAGVPPRVDLEELFVVLAEVALEGEVPALGGRVVNFGVDVMAEDLPGGITLEAGAIGPVQFDGPFVQQELVAQDEEPVAGANRNIRRKTRTPAICAASSATRSTSRR